MRQFSVKSNFATQLLERGAGLRYNLVKTGKL